MPDIQHPIDELPVLEETPFEVAHRHVLERVRSVLGPDPELAERITNAVLGGTIAHLDYLARPGTPGNERYRPATVETGSHLGLLVRFPPIPRAEQ